MRLMRTDERKEAIRLLHETHRSIFQYFATRTEAQRLQEYADAAWLRSRPSSTRFGSMELMTWLNWLADRCFTLIQIPRLAEVWPPEVVLNDSLVTSRCVKLYLIDCVFLYT
jgi:hypothetical protein